MKTPTDDLFRLVKSMTNGEKRHFRAQEGQNLTTQFFEIINEQNEYVEEDIKKLVRDESFRKNLKVHKNRLIHMLLASIRFHRDNTNEAQKIRENIDFIEILMGKQLYDMAWSLLQRSKKNCDACEEYELKLSLLSIQNRFERYFSAFDQDRAKVMQEMYDCIKIIENYTKLAQVCTDLIRMYQPKDQTESVEEKRQRVHAFLKRELFDRPELKPISSAAERMYNFAQAMWYRADLDFDNYCYYTARILEAFDANPKLQADKPIPHINSLYNHIIACQYARRTEELWDLIDRMEKMAQNQPSLETYLIFAYQQRIVAYKQEQRWEEAAEFYQTKVLPLAARPELYINEQFHFAVLRMVEVFLVENKKQEASDALQMLNKAFDYGTEWFDLAAVLEVVARIEQGDLGHLDNYILALQKRIQRHQIEKPFLVMFLAFAKKLVSTPPAEHPELFAKHLEKIQPFKTDVFFNFVSNCFMYENWVSAKAEKTNWKALLSQKGYQMEYY